MKKMLLVLAPEGYQDKEYSGTRAALENAGVDVAVASLRTGEAKGKLGGRVNVELSIDDVAVEDFDGVAFIGGPGMAELVGESRFVNLAKKFYEAGKITAAICIAPVILADAGILQEKRATVWPDASEEIKKAGGNYTGKSVEIDGKIITGNGPDAAKEFGEKIVEALRSL